MACSSCSMNVESYENYPWMPAQAAPVSENFTADKLSCKETMTNCLYTAQGMFTCQKETGDKPLVPNSSMASLASQQKNGAQAAAPWSKQ